MTPTTITRHLRAILRKVEDCDITTRTEDKALRAALAHIHATPNITPDITPLDAWKAANPITEGCRDGGEGR